MLGSLTGLYPVGFEGRIHYTGLPHVVERPAAAAVIARRQRAPRGSWIGFAAVRGAKATETGAFISVTYSRESRWQRCDLRRAGVLHAACVSYVAALLYSGAPKRSTRSDRHCEPHQFSGQWGAGVPLVAPQSPISVGDLITLSAVLGRSGHPARRTPVASRARPHDGTQARVRPWWR